MEMIFDTKISLINKRERDRNCGQLRKTKKEGYVPSLASPAAAAATYAWRRRFSSSLQPTIHPHAHNYT